MKLRSFFYILATLVLAMVMVGAVGFFWLTAQNPLSLLQGAKSSSPAAAMFVSKQAPVMVSLLVSPDRLQAFRQIAAPPAQRRQARAEAEQFKRSLLGSIGLDYQRDIQPWLGEEITWALTTLDIDRDEKNGRQPGYLVAVASQDAEQSRQFLQLFWQKRALTGNDLVFEQYKGVKLIYTDKLELPPAFAAGLNKAKDKKSKAPILTASLATAAVGDRFILFANHPKVLREAINNVQAEDLNLTNSRLYQRTLDSLNRGRIGVTFVNLPKLADWLGNPSALSVKKSSSGATGATGATTASAPYESLAVSLGLTPQGLLAETAFLQVVEQAGSTATPALSEPVGALQYLPGGSPFSASGKNLDQLWQRLETGLSGYDAVSQVLKQSLATLQSEWGIQLTEDVFRWVKGEYALGLLPAVATDKAVSRTRGSAKSSDWIFVAERSNTTGARQGIEHLDEIARKQGLSIGSVQLGDQSVSIWTRLSAAPKTTRKGNEAAVTLQAEIRGVHTSIGQYEIFTSSVEAMDQALKAPQRSLVKNPQFAQAQKALLQPNNGYLYLDWLAGQPLLEQRLPLLKVVELAGQPLFDHLRSLTLTSYGSQSGVQRGGVFINLQ